MKRISKKIIFRIFLIFSSSFFNLPSYSEEKTDSISYNIYLDEIEIVAPTLRAIDNDGVRQSINIEVLSDVVRNFGEADPIRYLRMMSGINQGSDYSSGISIQGCNYSQTYIDIAGAPILYPYHFTGAFSAFNADHYKSIILEKSMHGADSQNRLGGYIELSPSQKKVSKFSGNINIGMLSSNVYIETPICSNTDVRLSGRIAYFDLLYSSYLSKGGTNTKYNFQDLCLTISHFLSKNNFLRVNVFFNSDKLSLNDGDYSLHSKMKWGNFVSSAQWKFNQTDKKIDISAFYSRFSNKLSLNFPQFGLYAPNSIDLVGLKGSFEKTFSNKVFTKMNSGISAIYTSAQPQGISANGFAAGINNIPPRTNSFELTAFFEQTFSFSKNINADIGIKGIYYKSGGKSTFNIDPYVTFKININKHLLAFHLGIYHQYIHQLGFSEIGMSSDFWIPASSNIPAQKCYSLSANYNIDLNETYSLSIDAYYKYLYNQIEYYGSIYGMLDENYNLYDEILIGKGYNLGVGLSLRKNIGRLTGWINYSPGIALRHFDGIKGFVPSINQSLHNVNLFAKYMLSKHWNVAAAFAYNSGRPTTPINAIYVLGEQVISEYGERNSDNMPDYHRLDISASYSFNTEGKFPLSHTINISLLNVYCHKNVEMRYYDYNTEKGEFYVKENSSIYKLMPSISYSLSF